MMIMLDFYFNYSYCTPDASSAYCQRLAKYIHTNFNEYIQKNIKSLAKIDPYWHQVSDSRLQLKVEMWSLAEWWDSKLHPIMIEKI